MKRKLAALLAAASLALTGCSTSAPEPTSGTTSAPEPMMETPVTPPADSIAYAPKAPVNLINYDVTDHLIYFMIAGRYITPEGEFDTDAAPGLEFFLGAFDSDDGLDMWLFTSPYPYGYLNEDRAESVCDLGREFNESVAKKYENFYVVNEYGDVLHVCK